MTVKQERVAEVVRLIVELQDATQSVDEAAAAHLGVNLTDLRCLRVVVQDGPTPASDLARATGLTRSAITFAIDRLEKAGLAVRAIDAIDRRRTLVEPTESARRNVASLWGPIEAEGVKTLSRLSSDELAVIADFLHRATKLQNEHARRIKRAHHDSSAV